jgi:hypothetical protein
LKFDEWRGSFDGRPALFIKKLVRAFGCVVQLHKFVRADDEGCYHTHPAWAMRLILKGGYVEELGDGTRISWPPGMVGLVAPALEHRIHSLLDDRSSWSLWIRGPKMARVSIRGCD